MLTLYHHTLNALAEYQHAPQDVLSVSGCGDPQHEFPEKTFAGTWEEFEQFFKPRETADPLQQALASGIEYATWHLAITGRGWIVYRSIHGGQQYWRHLISNA